MKLFIDFIAQLPKWFVSLMCGAVALVTLICLWMIIDSTFISKQRKEIFGLGFGNTTTFDGRNSHLTMVKADNRAITAQECIALSKKALEENDYTNIQVNTIYVFGQFREKGRIHGWVGIDCGTQNSNRENTVNVSIAISGRNPDGESARINMLQQYFYDHSELTSKQAPQLSMIKADHRAINELECIELGRKAYIHLGYKNIRVKSTYVFADFTDSKGRYGSAGISCGSINDDWVNIGFSVSSHSGCPSSYKMAQISAWAKRDFAHLFVYIKRRLCGIASVDVRLFFV